MRGKLIFVVGLAVGYVVGTRQGRAGYDKLKQQANDLWSNPRVQKTVSNARDFAHDKAPAVGDALGSAIDKANGASAPSASSTSTSAGTSGDV